MVVKDDLRARMHASEKFELPRGGKAAAPKKKRTDAGTHPKSADTFHRRRSIWVAGLSVFAVVAFFNFTRPRLQN